jgi:unsaturated rhamnogalacturonyl hydrolase
MPDTYFSKVTRLCDYWVSKNKPEMPWMWGHALMGYALSELDSYLGTDKYTPFLKAFCDYYVKNPPNIDYADRAAPALITYAMQKKTGNTDYQKLTEKVLDYIRYEPRLIDDAVNHLGTSLESRFYPKSIWVDSLMMFCVFPARYAKEQGDKQLLDFTARQPEIYSRYLQDKDDKLWYHSYWIRLKSHYPVSKLYWGRGNGWVMCALPMILDHIGPDHPEHQKIRGILQDTAQALLKYQREDGTFATVLNMPGKTYRELSATALIAAGLLHGVRCGYLDKCCLQPGIKAFKAVAESITSSTYNGVFMPEISVPTIPLPLFPYLGYKLTPRAKNVTYGIAAAVFAAIEYDLYSKLP